MVNIKKRWLIFIIILPVMLYFIYYKWHEGTPYGEKKYSPNKKFYFQPYKVLSIDEWIPGFSLPGSSDGLYDIHGYVRVYTAEGEFIDEAYANGLPMARVFWSREKLIVMDGVNNADDSKGIIRLPRNTGLPW